MKAKKFLSAVLATAMLSTCFTASAIAADEQSTGFSANDLTVNENHTEVSGHSWLAYGTDKGDNAVYGNAKAYKLENVFGLGEDEYGIEMVAREQRADKAYMLIKVPDDVLAEMYDESTGKYNDFYLSSNIYLGNLRENDSFRLSGEWNKTIGDQTSRITGDYLFFRGTGYVFNSANVSNASSWGAKYTSDNWYNVTIACQSGVVKLYVDGKDCTTMRWGDDSKLVAAYDMTNATITNLSIGLRFDTENAADVGGDPAYAVVKDLNFVEGTYSNDNSVTTVTSDTYTVKAWSFSPKYLATKNEDHNRLAESYISGVDTSVTAGTLLSNVKVPAGAEKSVIKINSDDSKTVAVANDEKLADGMKLLVKTADGSMKLYDIVVETAASDLPEITLSTEAPARYTLDASKNAFAVPDTTVGTLLGYIEAGDGTTVKVTNNDGSITRANTDPVTDTMKVVAEKNGNKVEYSISVSKNTAVFSLKSYLADLTDETLIYEADLSSTNGGNTAISSPKYNKLYTEKNKAGLYGMDDDSSINSANWSTTASEQNYKVYKTTVNGKAGYRMTRTYTSSVTEPVGYIRHETNQSKTGTANSSNGKKMIINYVAKIGEGSEILAMPYYNNSNGSGGYVGAIVRVTNNEVIVAPKQNNNGTFNGSQSLGAYSLGDSNVADVTIVIDTAFGTSGTVSTSTVDAVYINGVKVNSEPKTVTCQNALSEKMRQFGISTKGEVSVAGLNIYMADDYNPNKADFVDADAVISDRVTDFGVKINLPLTVDSVGRIFGWNGKTAAEIKTLIDSATGTRVKVYDVTGTKEINDAASLETNMIVKVEDVNYADNAVTYVLTLNDDWGTWYTKSEDETTVTLARDIKLYQTADTAKNISVIFAAYKDGKMIEAKMQTATVKNDGIYSFRRTLSKVDGATYKAMIWDMTNNNKPWENAAPITVE